MSNQVHSESGLQTKSRVVDAANQNVDAVAGSDPSGIHPSKPGAEPSTTKGHQPGVLASEADRAPEFHAQILPAGTAPADRTFQPNPTGEVPLAQSNPSASDTIQGSTSSDVHTGLGHPGSGQTSTELKHGGAHTATKQSSGLEGVGAQVGQDRLPGRGPKDDMLGANDREGEPAETIAAENA